MNGMKDGWQVDDDPLFHALVVSAAQYRARRAAAWKAQRWLYTRRTNRRRPVLVATYRDDGAVWAEVEYEAERP